MKGPNAIEAAKEFGFYDPNNSDESALIREGSSLRYDEKLDKIVFHDAATGQDVEKYGGKMFDSDKSGVLSENAKPSIASIATEKPGSSFYHPKGPANDPWHNVKFEQTHSVETPSAVDLPTEHEIIPEAPAAEEAIRARIVADMDLERQPVETVSPQGGTRIEVSDHILQTHPEFAHNPFHLDDQSLIEVYKVNENNLRHIFPPDTLEHWNTLKLLKAKDILADKNFADDSGWRFMVGHLRRLQEVTGLKPKGGGLFRRAETLEKYIIRASQKVMATQGSLDSITLLRR